MKIDNHFNHSVDMVKIGSDSFIKRASSPRLFLPCEYYAKNMLKQAHLSSGECKIDNDYSALNSLVIFHSTHG